MPISIEQRPLAHLLDGGTAVVLQRGAILVCPALVAVDERSGGGLARAIAAAGFEGRLGEVLTIPVPAETGLDMLVMVGMEGANTPVDFRKCGARIATQPNVLRAGKITLYAPEKGAEVLQGLALRNYSFDQYRARQPLLTAVRICGDDSIAAELPTIDAETAAVHFARDLINEPANVLTPTQMAARVVNACEGTGISVQVLDASALRELGFGLHLAVGQGSANLPCVVVMRLGQGEAPPVALVGKGISFDAGGLHLKDFPGMWEMKADMGGAAAAAAAIIALARTGYTGNAIAVLGLAENMLGGAAIRPGDVVRSYAGPTVEIRDPDCEGRLVLADCLSYVQRALGAKTVIDIATLTYAVPIALGTRYSGLYGNSVDLKERIVAAADAACEKVWHLPIDEEFHAELRSEIADMVNWPGVKFGNGSIASAFLERFIDAGTAWAHLDIAGPSYASGGTPFSPPGGTGVIVETLVRLLRDLG